MGETVLITGGAGFIGRATVKELLRRGDHVRVLDCLIEQVHADRARPEDFPNDAELIVGDIRNRDVVARALRGVDSVIHLAAEVGVGQSMYAVERYTSVNAIGAGSRCSDFSALMHDEDLLDASTMVMRVFIVASAVLLGAIALIGLVTWTPPVHPIFTPGTLLVMSGLLISLIRSLASGEDSSTL